MTGITIKVDNFLVVYLHHNDDEGEKAEMMIVYDDNDNDDTCTIHDKDNKIGDNDNTCTIHVSNCQRLCFLRRVCPWLKEM